MRLAEIHLQAWIAIYSAFPLQFNYLVVILFSSLNYWLLIFIVQIVALAPRYTFKYIRSSYFPLDIDIVREMTILGGPNRQTGDTEIGKDDTPVFKHEDLPSPMEIPRMSGIPIRGAASRASAPTPDVDLEMSELPPAPRPTSKAASIGRGSRHHQRFASEDVEELGRADAASPISPASDGSNTQLNPRASQTMRMQRDSTGYQSISGRSATRSHAPSSSGNTPYASPQGTPNPYRQSHQSMASQGTQQGLTRSASVVSFSTAVDEPYTDSGDEYIHAR